MNFWVSGLFGRVIGPGNVADALLRTVKLGGAPRGSMFGTIPAGCCTIAVMLIALAAVSRGFGGSGKPSSAA